MGVELRGGSAEGFNRAYVIPKLTRIIDVKNLLAIFVQWGLAGGRRKSRSFFEVDQVCCYERRQFQDFELTLGPEIIDNVVYVIAPRDKVL
ncbi:MAG TPA: hypothetical protein VK568_13215 [Thermodesulfobacteriota bacterium]|nr:hypothetical protein [Thermodesulfobacteriota bacterium]